jgi:hypothetical protein
LREAELIDAGGVFDSPGNKELSVRFQRKAEWAKCEGTECSEEGTVGSEYGVSAPVDV